MSAIAGGTQAVVDSDGAALGDAALAALAVGAVDSRAQLAAWARIREVVDPDPALSDVLVPDHARFLALYSALCQWRAR